MMKPSIARLEAGLTACLSIVYPDRDVEPVLRRIVAAVERSAREMPTASAHRWSERDVVLITYGDSVLRSDEDPLESLREFLVRYLRDAVGIVHVLPFFPYSSDDGFSVIDYREVNPDLGDWRDLRRLGKDFDLMFDLVLNHISRESLWFLDYLTDRAPARDYFLEMDPDVDLSDVVRPRATPALARVQTHRGTRHVWATFSEDQIDLDYGNPDLLVEMIDVLLFYLKRGARYVRLDAVAFLWKRLGTSCVHLRETHEIVKMFRLIMDHLRSDAMLITETNVPNDENLAYFGRGDEANMVYQFALPPLVLHALHRGTGEYLTRWAKTLPTNFDDCTYLNFTASHDGIGLRPAEGLIPDHEVESLVRDMQARGAYVTLRTSRKGGEKPYEINVTYFDALSGGDAPLAVTGATGAPSDPAYLHEVGLAEPELPDAEAQETGPQGTAPPETGASDSEPDPLAIPRFLCSQTLPLSLRGIPAVYLHSLTATSNDHVGVGETGRVRSINRRKWKADELNVLLSDPTSRQARVFFELSRRLKVRRGVSAFDPSADQAILDYGADFFVLSRTNLTTGQTVVAVHNLTDRKATIDLSGLEGVDALTSDLVANVAVDPSSAALLVEPYQVLWLAARP